MLPDGGLGACGLVDGSTTKERRRGGKTTWIGLQSYLYAEFRWSKNVGGDQKVEAEGIGNCPALRSANAGKQAVQNT